MKMAYFLYTGYGKTKLILDKIMSFPIKPRVLLLSTKKIVESSWQDEINKWYPNQISYSYITGDFNAKKRLEIINQHTDILAMNVEMIMWYINSTTLSNDNRKINLEMSARFNMVIIDESSLFKSYRSKRFKAIKQWCSTIQDVFILSATPTPKSIENIWSQIYLLDGGQRLGRSITAFRTKYGEEHPLRQGISLWSYNQQAVDAILLAIKDICVSIPNPPAPLFPEPKYIRVLVKPDPKLEQIIEDFKKNQIIYVDGKVLSADNITQVIAKTNQLASGSFYDHGTTCQISDVKFETLKKYLAKITTPVLITYMYKFDKEKLLTLPGAVLLDGPKAFNDWNNNKIKIGIISPFSVAHGLNLQMSDCKDIIWFSPIYDEEKWQQTNARVCRRGQTREVTIRVFILKGSYDETIFNIVKHKFTSQYNNLNKLCT